uniref:Uncharacterized protein n=1 Tax=Musca domestica TaxID=7370 RepID=A0A1I8M2W6_MUSDO
MNCLFNINVCRVCMQNEKGADLLSNKDLLEKFSYATHLTVSENDNLPKIICNKCIARLKVSHSFIKQAHDSENNLKTFLAKINNEFQEVTKAKNADTSSSNYEDNDEQMLTEEEILEHINQYDNDTGKTEKSTTSTTKSKDHSKQTISNRRKGTSAEKHQNDKQTSVSLDTKALADSKKYEKEKELKKSILLPAQSKSSFSFNNHEETASTLKLDNIKNDTQILDNDDVEEHEIHILEPETHISEHETSISEENEEEQMEENLLTTLHEQINNNSEDESHVINAPDIDNALDELNGQEEHNFSDADINDENVPPEDTEEENQQNFTINDESSSIEFSVLGIEETHNPQTIQQNINAEEDNEEAAADEYLGQYKTMLDNQDAELRYNTDEHYTEENSVENSKINENINYTSKTHPDQSNEITEFNNSDNVDMKHNVINDADGDHNHDNSDMYANYMDVDYDRVTATSSSIGKVKTTTTIQRKVHRFYCQQCDRDFSTKTNLNRHMQSHEGKKPHVCPHCSKSFTQKSTLKQHIFTHTGEKPYICEYCDRGFTQCKSLIFHTRRHTGYKPFQCEFCLMTFRQKDALRLHILKYHVLVEQTADGTETHTCIICQKKFFSKDDFKIHMKIHTVTETENMYERMIVQHDEEYINATVTDTSASSASEPGKAKKFQCRSCFKCFALKKSLLRHMTIHSEFVDNLEVYNEEDLSSDHHQFACSACPDLIFKSIEDLKVHMLEHDIKQEAQKMALELCRLCGNNQNLIRILDRGPEMLEKLKKCANIEIKSDDILPKLICLQCDNTLEMSMLLRKQSEEMQERLKGELQKTQSVALSRKIVDKHQNEDVQYISDDEPTLDIKVKVSDESEAILPIEVDVEVLDTRSESTIVASETEDAVDYDFHIPSITIGDRLHAGKQILPPPPHLRSKSVSVDDIESSESYNSLNRKVSIQSYEDDDNDEDNHKPEYDIIEVTKNEFHNSDSCSSLLQPQESFSIDAMSINSNNEPLQTSDGDYVPPSRGSTVYTCVTCNEVFTRKKAYAEHILQHGTNRYQCIQCLAEFPTRYRLIRHETTHTEGQTYKCLLCSREYRAGYNLQRHIVACHSEKNQFECNICHLSFARQDVLKRHRDQIHLNINKKWHCKKCGKSFRAQYLFNSHKNQNTCSPEPLPKKKIAKGKKHSRSGKAEDEYIEQCPDDKYKCIICNMKFKCIWNCRNHIQTHSDTKPYPCSTCPKHFRTRYALINHERIHSNEKPFVCDICMKPFRQVTHMRHHRMLHTRDNLPVKCKECHQGFVTKWKLREHLRREHCTVKAFKCAECPEEFYLKYDLKRHARLVHLRSVEIAESDNEGVKNDTYVPDGTSDSEIYQYIQTEEDNDDHYADIDTLFNATDSNVTNVDTNQRNHTANVVGEGAPYNPINFINDNEVADVVENTVLIVPEANSNPEQDTTTNLYAPEIEHHTTINFINDHDIIDIDEVQENNVHDVDDDVQIIEDSITQTSQNPPHLDGEINAPDSPLFILNDLESPPPSPQTSNQTLQQESENQVINNVSYMDCIQLDSSNSCKSPPDEIVDNDFIEEEIHITEETYTTSTRYFNSNDVVQQQS